jgi:autotransporter family porin
MVRAESAWESTWNQSAVGDGGISYGVMQLKSTIQKGTFPLSRDATAFNADFALMTIRHCYDGRATWLGNGYRAGDIWGCIGYFYSGLWYDSGATAYITHVKDYLATRYWTRAGF